MHWPVPLRPNEKNDLIPLRPDGSRDVDEEWKITDTWKQLEDLQKKGASRTISHPVPINTRSRQGPLDRRVQHVPEDA